MLFIWSKLKNYMATLLTPEHTSLSSPTHFPSTFCIFSFFMSFPLFTLFFFISLSPPRPCKNVLAFFRSLLFLQNIFVQTFDFLNSSKFTFYFSVLKCSQNTSLILIQGHMHPFRVMYCPLLHFCVPERPRVFSSSLRSCVL